MTKLDSVFKSRDITLSAKVCLVKVMAFPVIMYGCWTIKKAEHWRTDAFELWCWNRLLRVPWTARRSDQSILKVISPEHSLERLMLKLKLQYFGHLMRRTDSFENTLMLGKIEGMMREDEIQPVHPKRNQSWIFIGRTDAEAETLILWPPDGKNWLTGKDPDARKDWRQEEKGATEDEMVWWHHRLTGHEFEQAPGVGDGQGSLTCSSPCGHKESDRTEWLNWTEHFKSTK